MSMRKECITISIEKVRWPELAHFSCEAGDDAEPIRQSRNCRDAPQWEQALKQKAKSHFRIGSAHRMKAELSRVVAACNGIEPPVVSEHVHPSAQLTNVRLGIGERDGAGCSTSNVRHDESACETLAFDKRQPRTVACRLRLLINPDVGAIKERDAPPIDCTSAWRAMTGERVKRECGSRRKSARNAEQLAHSPL